MKTKASCFILLLAILSSCSAMKEASPATHVANARSVYIALVETATDLSKAGIMPLKVMEQFELIRIRVAGMLSAADVAVKNGIEFNFSDLASTLESMQAILTIVAEGASR